MVNNVIKLSDVKNREAADLLDDLKNRLGNDDVSGMAVAISYSNGNISTSYTKTDDIFRMIGAVRHLENRLLNEGVE